VVINWPFVDLYRQSNQYCSLDSIHQHAAAGSVTDAFAAEAGRLLQTQNVMEDSSVDNFAECGQMLVVNSPYSKSR